MLDDRGLAPLTRWVQGEIYQRFHPSDCSKSQFLITNGWNHGFGSELHATGSHLAYALEQNVVLVWGPRSCNKFVVREHCGGVLGVHMLLRAYDQLLGRGDSGANGGGGLRRGA